MRNPTSHFISIYRGWNLKKETLLEPIMFFCLCYLQAWRGVVLAPLCRPLPAPAGDVQDGEAPRAGLVSVYTKRLGGGTLAGDDSLRGQQVGKYSLTRKFSNLVLTVLLFK